MGKHLYILKKISDGLYLQFTYFCHGNSEHRTSVPVAQWQRQRHRAMLEALKLDQGDGPLEFLNFFNSTYLRQMLTSTGVVVVKNVLFIQKVVNMCKI